MRYVPERAQDQANTQGQLSRCARSQQSSEATATSAAARTATGSTDRQLAGSSRAHATAATKAERQRLRLTGAEHEDGAGVGQHVVLLAAVRHVQVVRLGRELRGQSVCETENTTECGCELSRDGAGSDACRNTARAGSREPLMDRTAEGSPGRSSREGQGIGLDWTHRSAS